MPLLVPILPLSDGMVAEPNSRDGVWRVWAETHKELVVQYMHYGIEWVHLVDLDGRQAGRPVQSCTVTDVAVHREVMVSVEGGIRTWQHARMYLGQMIDVIYLGERDGWRAPFRGIGQREIECRVLFELPLPQSAVQYPDLAIDVAQPLQKGPMTLVLSGPLPFVELVRLGNLIGTSYHRNVVLRPHRIPDLAAWREGLKLTGGFIQAVMVEHRVLEELGIAQAAELAAKA